MCTPRLGPFVVSACSLALVACSSLDPSAPPWRSVDASPVPARWGQVASIDAKRDRMLVFGGDGAHGQLDDVWALDLASNAWSRLETTDGPGPRTDLAGVVDAAHDRLVVMFGRIGVATSIDEVWALDLATLAWSELPSGPPARHDVPVATDGEHAWVFGGAGAFLQSLDDLWELDLATDSWRALPDDGTRPPARGSSALTYHDGGVWLVGGHDVASIQRDVWRYDLGARVWQRFDPIGASVAGAHYGYAVDALCGSLFLAGGDNLDNFDVAFTDALALDGSARFARVPTSVLPPPRDHASLVFDSRRRELVLFGGGSEGDGLGLLGDAWRYAVRTCP